MDRKIYLTNLGKDLIAEAAKGGYEFQIVKVILGNGLTHAGKSQEELEKVTRIESPKAYLNEISIEKQSPNIILARAKLNTSEIIEESFRASETGLIARLKKSDGTYYPSEEGVLHEYRNIGDAGDWIPAKSSGEAWSLSYSIATVISNVAKVIPTIKGDITREEFEAHVNNESPHKNFMLTGKEVSKIDYVNVNYAGSGNAIDFVSFEKFKDALDNVGSIIDTYIEKDKTKKIYETIKLTNEFIPDEVISNTTPNDINNYYCTDEISGTITKVPVSDGVILHCATDTAKKFVNDNQLVCGQELMMIDGDKEIPVAYVGLNPDNTILFRLPSDPGELNNPKFVLTTAIVVPGKVFPNKLFESQSLNIKIPGLDWTNVKPSPGESKKTDQYIIGKNINLNLAGDIAQTNDKFEVLNLHNDDYFNAWNFNDNTNNLITSGLSLSVAGKLTYKEGLFGNKAIQPMTDGFAYNYGSYNGIYDKITKNEDFWFESWIKPSTLTSTEQVIYNEYQTIRKDFPIDDDVVFFVNFDGDTHEERMKEKIFGALPVIGYDEDSTTAGGIPNSKETPYKFEKINSRYMWLIDPDKLGEGNFTFEYFNSSDMLNDNGICSGLGYVYEKDGVKGFTAIALHDLTGKTKDHDNFRCYRPNVLPVDAEGVLTEEWKFEGINYQNLSFNEIPGSEPHWYSNHYCWHFSYTKADGINLISNMFKRSSSKTIDDVAAKELEEQKPYGGAGTYAYKVSIPAGAKFLGVGVIIECPPDEGYYYGGWADQIRIRKGIIDKTRGAGKILPIASSYDYKMTNYKNSPIFKVSLINSGTGNDLVLERFKGFSGSGDNRVAKVFKYIAKLNNEFQIDDWNHILIKDKTGEPELFIGSTKVSWINKEIINHRFDEQFLKEYIHILIGGESVYNIEAPSEIKAGLFNGLIQDLGMGKLNEDFTPIVPLMPIMSSELRGMAYATNIKQAIAYYNPLVSGTSELVKLISSEETGDIHIAFRKDKAVTNASNLFRLEINDTGKIGLVSIGTIDEHLYKVAEVIKANGNTSLTQFQGKEFVSETPDENTYLYPYIVLCNAGTKVSNIEIDKITTTTVPVYTYEDTKQLDFDDLKQIAYIKETIGSGVYDSMSLKFYGLNNQEDWKELPAGHQSNNSEYKSFKATLNVDFSKTHKKDGYLKVKSIDCIVKNNLLVTPGENSYLTLKPMIFNGNLKQIHSFIKYKNYDMIANDVYDFKIRHGVIKKNVEILPYAHKIYLDAVNILTENVLKKPGTLAPVKNGIKILETNEDNEFIKEITDFSAAYEIVNRKLKFAISLSGSVNSENNLNIIYYTAELSDWIPLSKVSDSNYLNSILLQYSKNKITGSNIIIPKVEIKTNDYIDFIADTGLVSSGKVETFVLNLKRKVNVNSVKVLLNNIEIPNRLVSATGGDGNTPLIIRADLRSQLLNHNISINFKYLGNELIDGFSDIGLILSK